MSISLEHILLSLALLARLAGAQSIDMDVQKHPFFALSANPCIEDPGFCFSVPTPPQDLVSNSFRPDPATTGGGHAPDYIIVELHWKPPAETYGELKGYQVSFRLIGPPELLMTAKRMGGDAGQMLDRNGQVIPTHAVRRNVTGTSYTSTQIDNIRKLF